MRMEPRTRWLLMSIALLLLLALLAWQFHREGLMSACHVQGGRWEGAASSCRFPDGRLIFRPDLRRI